MTRVLNLSMSAVSDTVCAMERRMAVWPSRARADVAGIIVRISGGTGRDFRHTDQDRSSITRWAGS